MSGEIDQQPRAGVLSVSADEARDRLVELLPCRIERGRHFEAMLFERGPNGGQIIAHARQIRPALVVIAHADQPNMAGLIELNFLLFAWPMRTRTV